MMNLRAPALRPRPASGRPCIRVKVAEAERTTTASASARFQITAAHKEAFKRDGFVHIAGVMSDEDMKAEVDEVYYKFLHGEIPVPGKDLNDFTHASKQDPSEFVLYNVMLPRTYYPKWQGNKLETVCQDIACQLLETNEVDLDFDQILAKRPRSRDSGVAWHQDAAYWPADLAETNCTTANMWVAVSDVPVESGCLRYVPGSHLEEQLRPHHPVNADEDSQHTLRARVGGETAVMVPMKRGDIVIHSERVVHGSGPNLTDNWRCGYILNFKRSQCVLEEREMGVTHSNNDDVKWQRMADTLKN